MTVCLRNPAPEAAWPLPARASARDAEAALDALLPSGFVVAARAIPEPGSGDVPPLFPEEAAAVARAVPTRRAEFAAGRAAARAVLGRLGVAACPLPVGPGRAPVWPQGIRGSLTHAGGAALAAAAPSRCAAGVGLDAEPDADLSPDLTAAVLLPSEMARLAGRHDALRCARRIFCVKEAVFKALFPLTGIWAGFEAAEMPSPPPAAGPARVRLRRAFGTRLAGLELPVILAAGGGLMMAAVVIPLGIVESMGRR